MKASMRVERPEDVEVTMTLTMPLSAWKKLRSQLDSKHLADYPASDLWRSITELSAQTQQTVLMAPPDEVVKAAPAPEAAPAQPVAATAPVVLKRRQAPAQPSGLE